MEMNGLKFFTRDGGFSGDDIREILSKASNKKWLKDDFKANVKKLNNMGTYCEGLREMIKKGVNAEDYEHPLKNLKIVIDPSNGVGGFYITDVLEPLGADTSGSVAVSPNGHFPTHQPNPENKAAMEAISQATTKANADLGIIFDTDCDRSACVDKNGKPINRNRLVALASYIALKECPGGIVVTDSVTSDGLTEFIETELGGIHRRFKRGYKNVIDEAKRLTFDEGNKAPLAIETSGHAAFLENYYLDDGAYLATQIVILLASLRKQGKTLDDVLKNNEGVAGAAVLGDGRIVLVLDTSTLVNATLKEINKLAHDYDLNGDGVDEAFTLSSLYDNLNHAESEKVEPEEKIEQSTEAEVSESKIKKIDSESDEENLKKITDMFNDIRE
jgi:phosphomannomutase